jgi:hypothetical protein
MEAEGSSLRTQKHIHGPQSTTKFVSPFLSYYKKERKVTVHKQLPGNVKGCARRENKLKEVISHKEAADTCGAHFLTHSLYIRFS